MGRQRVRVASIRKLDVEREREREDQSFLPQSKTLLLFRVSPFFLIRYKTAIASIYRITHRFIDRMILKLHRFEYILFFHYKIIVTIVFFVR